MRKSLKIFAIIAIAIIITGCGSKPAKSVVKKCTLNTTDEINGFKLESNYNIYATGKEVDKVITTEIVTSDNDTVLSYFETTLKNTYKSASSIYGGYTFNVTKEDGKVISNTTIDYSVMNLTKFIEDQPSLKGYVTSNNKLSLEGLKSLYESMGAVCEE